MAAIDFPNSPSDGDTHTVSTAAGSDVEYQWDASKGYWKIINDGITGPQGSAGSISVGTVTTGAAGSSASVTNSGTSSVAVFDFTIPQGAPGDDDIPQNAQTAAYTLVASDAGKHISITTGGVTIPASVFSAGDAVTIYNNSASDQTITQGSGLTLYLAGDGGTGNKTLAGRGLASALFISATHAVIGGAGLS